MKFIHVIFKIIASFVIAFGVLLYVVQEDPWCKIMLEKKFAVLMASFDTQITAQVKSLDITSLKVVLEQIQAEPLGGSDVWAWACDKCILEASLWELIRKRTLEITGSGYGFSVFSEFDGQSLAITEHVKALLASPFVVPITLNNLSIHHGSLDIGDQAHNRIVSLAYNSRTSMVGVKCKTAVSLTQTDITGVQALQGLSGQLECDVIARPSGLDMQANAQLSFRLSSLPEEQNQFVFSASAKDGNGYFDIHNDEYTLGGSITTVGDSLIARLAGAVPISYVEALINNGSPVEAKGLVNVQAEADLYDLENFARAQLIFDEPSFRALKIKKVSAKIKNSDGAYHGNFDVLVDNESRLEGAMVLDIQRPTGVVTINGKFFDNLFFNSSQDIDCTIKLIDKKVTGSCFIRKTESHDSLVEATIEGALDNICVYGNAAKKTFTLKGSLVPALRLNCLEYADEHKQALIAMYADENNFDGSLDVQILKGLVKRFVGVGINGEGAVNIHAAKTDEGAQGTLSFSGGLRLPLLYNGITDVSATWRASLEDRSAVLRDIYIGLHKGTLSSEEISFTLDDVGQLLRLSAPLSIRDCFISHHKDFFAILSGDCSINKDDSLTQITGALSIDRSHLKGNLLAGQVHSDVFMPSSFVSPAGEAVALDLNIATKEPLKVKTPFLQTSATINACVKGELPNIEGSGAIELKGGSLLFPFKPLYITSGKIMLMPQELDDPEIELHAKNTLKKYTVSVLATGTAKKPKITFNASPQLSEEQILTLLCTGSEDAGLLSAVPSVIMHNIQQLIFGPAEEVSTFTKYLKKIFRPFGSIRVVPTIGENKDHSGLHASVEVDINERIHGSVRKNLNTQEDTKVELEYALSDEMSIRGTKDERGDVSAEVEFRFNL